MSVPQLADFFLYLFREKALAPATVDGYRSAIANTLARSGSTHIGPSPELSALLRSFHTERPRTASLVPAWDLSVVLYTLQGAPFEPLGSTSLRWLTLKTVFLITLASGARRSEVHALSSKVTWGPEYSYARLRPVLGFLRKNQRPNQPPDTLILPALAPLLAPDMARDRSLCPVRALRYYLRRSSTFRGDRRRLFISFRTDFHKEIAAQTISTWLKLTVKECYSLVEDHRPDVLPLANVRAHEIRALASSWSHFNHVGLDHILEAATWRSPTVFTNHYLRDCSAFEDDLHRLSFVAARSASLRKPAEDPGAPRRV